MSAQERGLTVMQPSAMQVGPWSPAMLSPEDWAERRKLLGDLVMKGASEAQVSVAIATCKALGFDPILNHVNLIEGAVYVTHKGLLHAAHRSGQFDGIELLDVDETQTHWVARVAVYRKDMSHPFVYPGRYSKAARNKVYGQEMAITRAECMALRRAFDLSLPVAEEFDRDEERPTQGVQTVIVGEVDYAGPRQIGQQSDISAAGAGVPGDELGAAGGGGLDWTQLWRWLKARGINTREDIEAAIGGPIAGRTPQAIGDLLVAREVASARAALPAAQKTQREYSVSEKGDILIGWLAKQPRTQEQQYEKVERLFGLSDDQQVLETWHALVTEHVHQDVRDQCWFDRMNALGRLHVINGQATGYPLAGGGEVVATQEELPSGEPRDDVPF